MKARKAFEKINWDVIRQRIAAAEKALQEGFSPSSVQRQEILHARARELAREEPVESLPDEEIDVLEFILSGENYALEAAYVREVYTLKEITPLPCTPSFVVGIVNIRGSIMSVLDIKKLLNFPEKGLTDQNKVIVLQDANMQFALLVDQVVGTCRIPLTAIQIPQGPSWEDVCIDRLKGVTAKQVTVLNAKGLLTDKTIVINQEVLG